jgi:uncharacterized protein (DUF433 family)
MSDEAVLESYSRLKPEHIQAAILNAAAVVRC